MNSYKRSQKRFVKEASDWFLTNREGADLRQRVRFFEWLRTDVKHVDEYLRVTQVARDLDRLKDDPAFSLDKLLERARNEPEGDEDAEEEEEEEDDERARSSPVRPRVFGVLAAAAAMALVAVVGFRFLAPQPVQVAPTPVPPLALRLSTGHGEHLTRRMHDGSVVNLNSDTEVVVTYEKEQRLVALARGQAVFEVVHDAARPFRVQAGPAEILDVGTKFDVYVRSGSTRVTVLEGQVSVRKPSAARELLLSVGDQVRVDNGELPAVPTRVDAQQATAWLRGQISFKHQALAEVVEEFNRYNKTPIEIETPELGELEISGIFAQNDTESFVAFLRSMDGVHVDAREDRIRVSRR